MDGDFGWAAPDDAKVLPCCSTSTASRAASCTSTPGCRAHRSDGRAADDLDATGLAAAIRAGELTAREAVEHALVRIDERNETLNAVTEQCADAALAQVEAGVSGPFAGVPFVVKDLGVDVAGLRSTGGSRPGADVVATPDSLIVERYRAAGLVIVGTTNTPELGRSASTEPLLHGPTRNPCDLSRSPGGSTGGTAAAVAAGMVPAAHGNDGGGSIRIPASACGLVGLKPSRGRTPSLPRPRSRSCTRWGSTTR